MRGIDRPVWVIAANAAVYGNAFNMNESTRLDVQ